jgi:hypothetical protein
VWMRCDMFTNGCDGCGCKSGVPLGLVVWLLCVTVGVQHTVSCVLARMQCFGLVMCTSRRALFLKQQCVCA